MIAPRQIWRKVVDTLFPSGRRAEALYASAVRQARQPAFYAALHVPDTPEGRFEMVALHVILLIDRLMCQAASESEGDAGQRASGLARELQERMFDELDASLREMGVSDVAVPKRMRRLGVAFYERMKKYHAALAADDAQALKRAFLGHIYAVTAPSVLTGKVPAENAEQQATTRLDAAAMKLAEYVLRTRPVLNKVPLHALQEGRIPWPAPQGAHDGHE